MMHWQETNCDNACLLECLVRAWAPQTFKWPNSLAATCDSLLILVPSNSLPLFAELQYSNYYFICNQYQWYFSPLSFHSCDDFHSLCQSISLDWYSNFSLFQLALFRFIAFNFVALTVEFSSGTLHSQETNCDNARLLQRLVSARRTAFTQITHFTCSCLIFAFDLIYGQLSFTLAIHFYG